VVVELAYPYTYLLSGPLGVSERLIVSEKLEEYKPKEYKYKYKEYKYEPREHKQPPKRL
jgi:hypothetical protein